MPNMFDQLGAATAGFLNNAKNTVVKALDFTNNVGSRDPIGTVVAPQSTKGIITPSAKNPNAITLNNSSAGTHQGLIPSSSSGAMTSTQLTNQQHNTALMASYGPGNYTIDAGGNVLPKSSPTQNTQAPSGVTSSPQSQPEIINQQPPQYSTPTPTYSPPPMNTGTQNPSAYDYPGIVQGLISASNLSPNQTTANAALMAKAQGPTPEYLAATAEANKYNAALGQSRINEARGLAANAENPIPLEFQQGRGQIQQSQYAQEQAALGAAYQGAVQQQNAANVQQNTQQSGLVSAGGLANTQQQQQIGGLSNAASYSQPVSQFGMLTNPMTGAPLNTQVFQSAIQQAQQLINSGVPADSQQIQALTSPFGFVGPMALNNMMQAQATSQGGSWNPSAQSAGAQQTLSQGTNTQGQAYALNLGLQQLKTIQPVITNFLQASGINSTDSPLYNQPINNYIQKLGNPAATTQYQYMLNDLQKFASQMLSAGGGGTPTGTQAATDLMNPGLLSMSQIQSALNTLDTLGTNQVAVLQNQAKASGVSGYAGNPAAVSTSTPVASPSNSPGAGVTSPLGQAAAGTGLDVGSWALNTAKNLGSELVGFIGGILAK